MSTLNLPTWSISALAVRMKKRNRRSVKVIEAKIRITGPRADVFKFFGVGHTTYDKATSNLCMVATFDCKYFNLACTVEKMEYTQGEEIDFVILQLDGDYDNLTLEAMGEHAFEMKSDAVITGERQDELELEQAIGNMKPIDIAKAQIRLDSGESASDVSERIVKEHGDGKGVSCEKENT